MDIPLPDDNISCNETKVDEPAEENIGNEQINETPGDEGTQLLMTKADGLNKIDETNVETVSKKELVDNGELVNQDEFKEVEDPSILDIPVPEISLQYSPSVPNEDEIIETTQDVLDISLPEGPGVGSILPSKSVVKKRLQSMLKQTAANKLKIEPIEFKLKDKEKGQEKDNKKKFSKKLSVADVQARNTISEIEEMKRKENETRDSILIMELMRKKQKEEAKAARAEKEALAKVQKARERSEERKRRRERDRLKEAARETRKREEEGNRDTKGKKDPLKLKNWKEFSKEGYSVHNFRRKKSRSALERDKQNKLPDRTKYNLLEAPKVLRTVICAQGPYNKTAEYPSWCRRSTSTRPSVEYCFNPAFETCHFQTRQQMIATLPDDILDIVNHFLSSMKGKRLVSSVDNSKSEATKRRHWFSKVFLDETDVKPNTEEYEVIEEDPEPDIEGRWKDDILEETKISDDGNDIFGANPGKPEKHYSIDVEEKLKDSKFPLKEESKYFNEPNENVADIDIEGKWKYSPLAEPQSPDIEGKWKYSPLPEQRENVPADSPTPQSEQILKFTDAEGKWKDNLSLKPSLSSKNEVYQYESLQENLNVDISSHRNKALSENESKLSDFEEERRDKSPKLHKSHINDKAKLMDVLEERKIVDDSRRKKDPLAESISNNTVDERRKKISPSPKHKRSSRDKRKESSEESPRRRSRSREKNKSFEGKRRGSPSRRTSSSFIEKSKESPKLQRKRSYNEMEWSKIQEEENMSKYVEKRNKNNEIESNSSGDEDKFLKQKNVTSKKASSKDVKPDVGEESHKVDASSLEAPLINLDEICLPSEPIDRESSTNICNLSQDTYKPEDMELDENKSPLHDGSIKNLDNRQRNDENISDNFTEESQETYEHPLASSLTHKNSPKEESRETKIDSGDAVKESLVSEYEEFMKMVQLDNKSKDVNSPDIKYLEHQRSNILEAIGQSYSPKKEIDKEGEDGDDVSWSKSSSYDVKENVFTITPDKIKSKSLKKDSAKKEKLSKQQLKKKRQRQSMTESSDSSESSDSDSSSSSSSSSSSTTSSSSSDSSSSSSSSDSSNSDNSDDEKMHKKKKKSSVKKKKTPKKKKKSVDIKSKEFKPSKKNKRVKDKKLINEKDKSKLSGKKKGLDETKTKEKSEKIKKSKINKSESEEDTPFKDDKKSKSKSKELKKGKLEKKIKVKKNKKKPKYDEKTVNKKHKSKKKNKDKKSKKEKRDKSSSVEIKSKKHKSKKRRESTESSDDEDFSDIDRFVELLSKNKTVKDILFDGGDLELPLFKELNKEQRHSDDESDCEVPLSKDLIVNKNIINLDELEIPFPKVTEREEDDSNSDQLPLKKDTREDILDDVSLVDVPLPEEDINESEIPLCKEKTSRLEVSDMNRPVSVESEIYEPSYSPDNQSEDENLAEELDDLDKDTVFSENCNKGFDVSTLGENSSINKLESKSKVESFEISLSEISETSLSYQMKNKFTDSVEGLKEETPEKTGIEIKEDTKNSSCGPVLKDIDDVGVKDSEKYSPGMSEDDDEDDEEIACKPVSISKSSWSETENSPNFTFPKQEIEDSKGSYLSVENIPLPSAESSCTDLPRGSPNQSVISESDTKDSNSSSAELKVKKNPTVFSPEKDSNAQHASPHSFITMKLPIARLTFEKQVVKIKQNNIFSDEDSDPENKDIKSKLDLSDEKCEVPVDDSHLPSVIESKVPSEISPTKKSRWFGEEILATAETVGPSLENKELSKSSEILDKKLPEPKEGVVHRTDSKEHKLMLDIDLKSDQIKKLTPLQQVSIQVESKFKNDVAESLSGSKIGVSTDSEQIQGSGEEDRLKNNNSLSEGKIKSPARNLSPFQNRSNYSPPRQNPIRGGSKSPIRKSPLRKSKSHRSPRRSPYKGRSIKSPSRRSPFRDSSRKTGNRSPSRERSGRTRSKRSSSYDRYRKSPIRGDRYRNSPSRDKYRKSPVRERYRKSSPRDKHRNSPSKDRYIPSSSKERYRESPIKDRLKESSSKEKYSKSPSRLSPLPEKYRKSPVRRSPFKDRPKSPPPRRSPSWRDRNPDPFTRSPDISKNRPRRWDVSPKYSNPAKRSRTRSPEIKAKLLPYVNKPHPLETLLEASNKPTTVEDSLWNNVDPSINTYSIPPCAKDPNNQNLISITPHKFSSSGLADSTSQSESNEADPDDERRMSLDDRIRLELGVDVLSESGQKKFRYQNQESFYQSTEGGQKVRGVSTSNLISLTGDWPSSPLSTKSKPTLDRSGKPPPQSGPEVLGYVPDVHPLPVQPCLPSMPSTSLLKAPPPPINAMPLPMQPPNPLPLPPQPLPTDVGNTSMPFNLPPVKSRSIETPVPNIVPVVAVQYSRNTDSSQPPLPNTNKSDETLQPSLGGLDPLIKKYLSNLQPGSKSLPLPEISEEEQQQMSPVMLLSSPACPTPLASIPITLKKFVKDKSEAMLKRKEEKEKRRREKELKHKRKQEKLDRKLQRQRALLKEGFIKSTDLEDEEEPTSSYLQDPSYLDVKIKVLSSDLYPPAGKSILCYSGFGLEMKKSVSFADGIKPGEGESPANVQEEQRTPPIGKTGSGKKKRKVKVRIVRMGDEEGWSPPPPPPGTPPPEAYYTYCTPDGFIYSSNQPNTEILSNS